MKLTNEERQTVYRTQCVLMAAIATGFVVITMKNGHPLVALLCACAALVGSVLAIRGSRKFTGHESDWEKHLQDRENEVE